MLVKIGNTWINPNRVALVVSIPNIKDTDTYKSRIFFSGHDEDHWPVSETANDVALIMNQAFQDQNRGR